MAQGRERYVLFGEEATSDRKAMTDLVIIYFGHLALTRVSLQRGMAETYFVAFLSVLNQAAPLVGTRGLLPIRTL